MTSHFANATTYRHFPRDILETGTKDTFKLEWVTGDAFNSGLSSYQVRTYAVWRYDADRMLRSISLSLTELHHIVRASGSSVWTNKRMERFSAYLVLKKSEHIVCLIPAVE